MGQCTYCGESAGVFSTSHPQCEERHAAGINDLKQALRNVFLHAGDLRTAKAVIAEIGQRSYVNEVEKRAAIVEAWEKAAYYFLDDGALEPIEEERLAAYKREFQLVDEELNRGGMASRVGQAAVLRELLSGRLPVKMPDLSLERFNFQKNERPVWGFGSVEYHEDRTKRVSTGGSQGVSIRVAKGLYFRLGGFKAESVTRAERLHVDTGMLVMTDRHLYFSGPRKSFRVRYEKVVSHTPHHDGFTIVRDAASAMPQTFLTGDGWFAFNLLANLAQR